MISVSNGPTILVLAAYSLLAGCASVFAPPASLGEQAAGYTYVPVDPFPVKADSAEGEFCDLANSPEELLKLFPDNAVRVSQQRVDTSAEVTYGQSSVGARSGKYIITVDYINADTEDVRFWIKKEAAVKSSSRDAVRAKKRVPLIGPLPDDYDPTTVSYSVRRVKDGDNREDFSDNDYEEYSIPTYVGIGLRVTANVEVVGARANIAGLGVIGAEAEAERLRGSLVVQTLGVNGRAISAALPIQSELNRTTAQNAVVAIASIKALLYDDGTIISPRVVGIYLPFPADVGLVNAIISEISKNDVDWVPLCPVD